MGAKILVVDAVSTGAAYGTSEICQAMGCPGGLTLVLSMLAGMGSSAGLGSKMFGNGGLTPDDIAYQRHLSEGSSEIFEGGTATQRYSNFADGMSPEDAVRYIANHEKAFFNEFYERASVSGVSDAQIAEVFEAMRTGDHANSIGGIIMEQTPGGQVFDNWRGLSGMYPEWDTPTNLAQKPIWDALLSQYANGAEGIATYVHSDGYVGKVWSNIEKPILEEKELLIQEEIIDAK